MTSIKIDFAEEVSVDTILTPVFDKEQKCIGGLLYDGKKPEKKKYVPVPEMISLVQGYTRLLCFAQKDLSPLIFGRTYAFRMMLGDCVLAYQIYESQGTLGLVYQKTVSRADFVFEYGD
ncbi:MAG: hypothetical protein ACLUH4_03895 [Alphaproteobacteria bacterium]|jgi:hypothetical protein|nr:unknown [Azospirillum sp. CAG:239]